MKNVNIIQIEFENKDFVEMKDFLNLIYQIYDYSYFALKIYFIANFEVNKILIYIYL